jgi:hypothetical protein
MNVRLPVVLSAACLVAACASSNPALTRTYNANDSATVCLIGPFSRAADGSVTKADVRDGIQRGFAGADTNRDGVLDFDEVGALNTASASSCDQTSWIIRDPSGMRIEQYGARYLTAFADADVNLDGVATREEIITAKRASIKVKRKAPSEPQGEQTRSPGDPTNRGSPNAPY